MQDRNRQTKEKAEKIFNDHFEDENAPLITQDQLDKIMSITDTKDPEERQRRYNAVYQDLQRQAELSLEQSRAMEDAVQSVSGQAGVELDSGEESDEEACLLDAINAEAKQLMSEYERNQRAGKASKPRSRRMTI